MSVSVTLTSCNLGDATEADYDRWVSCVSEHLETRAGFGVSVDADKFGTAGDDRISGGTNEQRETLRQLLSVDLWDEWCSSDNDVAATA